jgi:hypothetical protein
MVESYALFDFNTLLERLVNGNHLATARCDPPLLTCGVGRNHAGRLRSAHRTSKSPPQVRQALPRHHEVTN